MVRSHGRVGIARIGSQAPISAELVGSSYEFLLPGQIDIGQLDLRIGDYQQTVEIEPMVRPELTGVTASVELPEYLGRAGNKSATYAAARFRRSVAARWSCRHRPIGRWPPPRSMANLEQPAGPEVTSPICCEDDGR